MISEEWDLSEMESATSQAAMRDVLGAVFWAWYAQNEDRALLVVRKWFVRHTFVVRDLRPVFVLLFGEPLAGA
jgi:hypothetical protein